MIFKRTTEAGRIRPILGSGVDSLEAFCRIIESSNLKPEIVKHGDLEAVRFVNKTPEEALLLKFARLVSMNRAMLLLMDYGFVQEQAAIQRSIEETNEDILFLTVNITGTASSEKFASFLDEFWKEDYEDPRDPVGTRVPRAFSRRGIRSFLNRYPKQEDPSTADQNGRSIWEMYSGFTHGAAPQILELYDYENRSFLVNGLVGTNRHLDYVFDAQNSVYRSLISAGAVAKSFGSEELLSFATGETQKFTKSIGLEKLEKQPDK